MSALIKGADVSHLLQLEAYGARFGHEGEPGDVLHILKAHGLNAIRIKVWNDPGNPCCFPANQADPAGYNNLAHVLQLALRARETGFRIMIDLHYSDWWADPAKQYIPHAWEGQTIDQLVGSVYTFTHQVLSTLKERGVTPEWVQIGNEISNGMLWPLGSTDNWDNLAALIQAGCRAASEVVPTARRVLHYDNGGSRDRVLWWFDNAQARQVEWDIVGLSYYPQWHGSLSDLSDTMHAVVGRYGTGVVIAETAYPWTTHNGDAQPNVYTHTGPVSYPMSPAGQEQFLNELVLRLKAVPGGLGLGFFYWEPEWIPVEGAGWRVGQGDEWDNVTLFDFDGHALPTLDAFAGW